jgi:hypothetical protein
MVKKVRVTRVKPYEKERAAGPSRKSPVSTVGPLRPCVKIRNIDSADESSGTCADHSLPADRIDKAVHYSGKRLRSNFRSANNGRISVHAVLPTGTCLSHVRDPTIGLAMVCEIEGSAGRDLLKDLCKGQTRSRERRY